MRWIRGIAAACAFWFQPVLAAQDPPTEPSPSAIEANDRWKGYVAAGLFLGSVYVIGRQNNGEKILGAVWLLAAGQGHGSKDVGAGLLALSAYNFFYLTRGGISNERVARDNLIGLGLLL